ncbi:MAG TPA: nitrate reductase associated protein [Sandaracinaceae bacterium LLY-WYZ-13_1]|nr:nitrate reductase associated protein [Sandaracinaceae bacterium LLY-WYZ-13_1]
MEILPFEDDDLTLIPMAGRRALDRAGLRLSLRAWQGLSYPVRSMLVGLGSAEEVDADDVRALLASADPPPEPFEAPAEPPADRPPEELIAALSLPPGFWAACSPVARFALASYARRGKTVKLRTAYEALLGSP